MNKFIYLIVAAPVLFYGCSKSKNPPPVTTTQTSGVTTYIGNGTAGLVNGTGPAVEFNLPVDMALNASADIFVSEQGNNVIRVITPAGTVATYAGNGTQGYKDGPAASAEFDDPEGMVIDDVGNLYVADAGNNVIRVITPTGIVSTYAGTGTAGYKNGAGNQAEFALPDGLAIDKARNIYVADFSNNVIRKITPAGVVSTYAGTGAQGFTNGAAASATFHAPSGMIMDDSNNLYVAEASNGAIRKITPDGTVSTFAASLPGPAKIALDISGDLYVSCGNNTIQKVNTNGIATTYTGTGTPGFMNGPLLSAEFNTPLGLLANSIGTLLVVDHGNNSIRLVTP